MNVTVHFSVRTSATSCPPWFGLKSFGLGRVLLCLVYEDAIEYNELITVDVIETWPGNRQFTGSQPSFAHDQNEKKRTIIIYVVDCSFMIS